jgi:hypothetical protein
MRHMRAFGILAVTGWLWATTLIAQVTVPAMAGLNRDAEAASRAIAERSLTSSKSRGRGSMTPLGPADSLSTATLGPALPVYYVPIDKLREYEPNSNPLPLLSAPTSVIYTVMAGGAATSAIEVSKTASDGEWAVAIRGRAALAKDLAEQINRPGEVAGTVRLCVWVAAMDQRFYGALSNNTLRLTPLSDDPEFEFRKGVSLPAATVFTRLRPAALRLTDVPGR